MAGRGLIVGSWAPWPLVAVGLTLSACDDGLTEAERLERRNRGLVGQLAGARWASAPDPLAEVDPAAPVPGTGGPQPPDASWATWQAANDHAVVLFERARHRDHALDLVHALDAVTAARDTAPSAREPRYNLALITEALGLRRMARRTWQGLLAADTDLPRAVRMRAEEAIVRLGRPDRGARWRAEAPRLDAWRGDRSAVADWVARFPAEARRHGQGPLLRAWLRARETDAEEADRLLDLGSALGEALVDQRGDHLVQAVFAHLPSAAPASLHGITAYLAGLEAFESGRYAQADRALRRASEVLGRRLPPLAWLARYLQIYSATRGGHQRVASVSADGGCAPAETGGLDFIRQASRDLETLLAQVDEARFPSLAGRVRWRLGVTLGIVGESARAIAQLQAGTEQMARSSGDELEAIGHMLLAEEHGDIGDRRRAWQARSRALAGLAYGGRVLQIQGNLHIAMDELLAHGLERPARWFSDEMMALAAEAANVRLDLHANLSRGAFEGARGDVRAASAAFARARAAMPDDPGAAPDLRTAVAVLEAEAIVDQQPERAWALVTSVLDRLRCSDDLIQLVPALLTRARANRRLGRSTDAEQDLRALIERVEAERDRVDRRSLPFALAKAQAAFDLLALQQLEAGRPNAAFDTVERGRARYLRDGGLVPAPRHEVRAVDVAPSLPADTALVAYAALTASHWWAWVAWQGRLRAVRLEAAGVAAEVTRLVDALERAGSEAVVTESAEGLHARLIAPLGLDLDAVGRLAIVPDRRLVALPFAVLRDDRGRHLLERVAITEVPSVSHFLAPNRGPGSGTAVVLAAPEAVGDGLEALPPLDGAVEEGERVARALGGDHAVRLLLGAEATRAAVLRALDGAAVLHVASHAFADPAVPGRSRLVVAGDADSGALRAGDLIAAGTRLDLLVLSACRTFAGLTVDREGSLGMASLLFGRVADAVVANRWLASDAETVDLMATLHQNVRAGHRASASWRQAVLGLRRAAAVPTWVWANVVVVESAHGMRRGPVEEVAE